MSIKAIKSNLFKGTSTIFLFKKNKIINLDILWNKMAR